MGSPIFAVDCAGYDHRGMRKRVWSACILLVCLDQMMNLAIHQFALANVRT